MAGKNGARGHSMHTGGLAVDIGSRLRDFIAARHGHTPSADLTQRSAGLHTGAPQF